MSRRTLVGAAVVVLALVGVGAAIDLTLEHVKVIEAAILETEHESWCQVEGTSFDCAKVSSSRWSEHPLPWFRYPLPTSIPPLGFFAGFAVLVLLGLFRSGRKGLDAAVVRDQTLAFAWLLLLPAAVVDLLLIYVMKFQLKTWCIVCLGLDLATLLLIILTPLIRSSGWRGLFGDAFRSLFRHHNWLVFAAVFVTVVLIGQRQYSATLDPIVEQGRAKAEQDRQNALDEFADTFADQTPIMGLLRGDEPHRGTPGAPFQVIEFADFQCPYCAVAALEIHELTEAYPGLIDFAFRHYPLCKDCHPYVSRNLHPDACMAAYALECAGRHGKYWEMYDSLFTIFAKANTEKIRPTVENMREIAHFLEIPASDFYYCLEEEEIRAAVIQDVEDGRKAGVRGTPAVFVNGVLIDKGGASPAYLERLLRDHLAAKGEPLPAPLLLEE